MSSTKCMILTELVKLKIHNLKSKIESIRKKSLASPSPSERPARVWPSYDYKMNLS